MNPQNQTQQHISAQKNARNALERVENLEKDMEDLKGVFPRLIQAMSEPVNQLAFRLDRMDNRYGGQIGGAVELIDAVTEILGVEKVQEVVKKNRVTKAREVRDTNQAALQRGVAEGKFVKADVVSTKTVIIGKEIDAAGVVQEPGWILIPYNTLSDARDRDELLGKTVGFQHKTQVGNIFEIIELWDGVPPATAADAAAEAAADAVTEAQAPEQA